MNQNLSKQQIKKLKKDKKRREQRRQQKIEKVKSFLIQTTIAITVLLGLFFLVKSQIKIRGKQLGEAKQIEGRNHILPGEEHNEYKTNPPTSGPHYGDAQPGGYYNQPIQDERAIHSLEHGYVWITYKDQPKEVVEELQKLGKKYVNRVVISPREENDSPIALASWGRLSKLETFNKDEVIAFIENNYNLSPERLAK